MRLTYRIFVQSANLAQFDFTAITLAKQAKMVRQNFQNEKIIKKGT